MSPFSSVSETTPSPWNRTEGLLSLKCYGLAFGERAWIPGPLVERGRELAGLLRHADRDGDPLVPIPDRDFGDPGDLGDLFLRARLGGEDRRDVDCRGGHPTRRDPGGEFVLLDLVEDLLRLPLHVHVELQPVAEARDVVPRALRQEAESEFPDQGPVRPADRLSIDARLRGNLVEGPRHTALPARGVQGRGHDLVDRPSADEVLRRRPSVQDRGALPHVAREAHLRGHRVDLRQALREGPLPAFRRPDPVLPLPQPVDLGPRLVRDLPSVGILVPPSDRGRETLVVRHDGARRACALPRLPLLRVEGAPFRALIDDHLIQDEPAVFAHDLRARIVPNEVVPTAFWTLGCYINLLHTSQSSPEERQSPYEPGII